jgi:hypothetical protein
MSYNIKVGDLVMVVRGMPCCGALTGAEGHVFTVTAIRGCLTNTRNRCNECKDNTVANDAAANGHPTRPPIQLSRLKVIPPLENLEHTTTKEEVTA